LGSTLVNKWKIHELLPNRISAAQLKQNWGSVRRNLRKGQARAAYRYNSTHYPVPFKVGDLVYYKNHPNSNAALNVSAKRLPRWKGPYRTQEFLTPVTARLVDPNTGGGVTRAHVSLLKPGPQSWSWLGCVLDCGHCC
jgi:hypothetical protein